MAVGILGLTEAGKQGGVPSPKLVSAAHEFEAMMMKELLAPVEQGAESLTGEEETGSGNALGSYAAEALGRAISARGGFGIAESLLHHFSAQGAGVSHSRSSNHSGTEQVPQFHNEIGKNPANK